MGFSAARSVMVSDGAEAFVELTTAKPATPATATMPSDTTVTATTLVFDIRTPSFPSVRKPKREVLNVNPING